MKVVEIPKETHYMCREIAAERDAAMETLNVLLCLHDAKVDTAAAWNETFEEARELLAAKRQEGV